MAKKEDIITVNGVVIEILPHGYYKVEFGSGHPISASVSPKFLRQSTRIKKGDNVTVQMSTFDLTRGVITARSK